MLKELGLVVTGFAVGVGVTLYYTKDLIVAVVTHTLADVFEEEIEDVKDKKRDYTKPLRKSGKYPWGEYNRNYAEPKEAETFALPMLISNHDDAVKVLNSLLEHVDVYKFVSVADYYDLVGVSPTYKDTLYGWTGSELTDARIITLDGEYSISLPVAKKLNK